MLTAIHTFQDINLHISLSHVVAFVGSRFFLFLSLMAINKLMTEFIIYDKNLNIFLRECMQT